MRRPVEPSGRQHFDTEPARDRELRRGGEKSLVRGDITRIDDAARDGRRRGFVRSRRLRERVNREWREYSQRHKHEHSNVHDSVIAKRRS